MDNNIYLLANGGVIEVTEYLKDWYLEMPATSFTEDYDGILSGKYLVLTGERLDFYKAHPNLSADHIFYMTIPSIEVENEQIRQQRENAYKANSDSIYMAYIKYKEFGELDKAEEKYNEWKAAVVAIDQKYPYIVE